jgi:hypothetical protein
MRLATRDNLAGPIGTDAIKPAAWRKRVADPASLHLQSTPPSDPPHEVLEHLPADPFQSLDLRAERGNFINRHRAFYICKRPSQYHGARIQERMQQHQITDIVSDFIPQ